MLKNMTTAAFAALDFSPCDDGRAYGAAFESMADVWENCPRVDWLAWILDQLGIGLQKPVFEFTFRLARRALLIHEEKYPGDNRVRIALEFGEGLLSSPVEVLLDSNCAQLMELNRLSHTRSLNSAHFASRVIYDALYSFSKSARSAGNCAGDASIHMAAAMRHSNWQAIPPVHVPGQAELHRELAAEFRTVVPNPFLN